MKKNSTMRVAALLLALTLITSCFVGGTFAKYTDTISAAGTATIAKFEVAAFGETATTEVDSVEIDVFDDSAIFDTYGDAEYSLEQPDEHIAEGVIAPGSWGKYSYTVKNTSDVTVNYTIDYTVDEDGVPLMWSLDGQDWSEDLDDVTTAVPLSMEDASDEDANQDTITIYWRWVFDGDDTELGIAGTAAPKVEIAVTFTQVD